jgi:hypothetical protein
MTSHQTSVVLERAMSAKNNPTWRPLNGAEGHLPTFQRLVVDYFQT